eukprot:6832305-Pyramimonas_sp.AAC.1
MGSRLTVEGPTKTLDNPAGRWDLRICNWTPLATRTLRSNSHAGGEGRRVPVVRIPFGGAQYRPLERVRDVPKLVVGTHVITAAGGVGGAPHGAMKRVRGVPKWVAGTHVVTATGAFGGAPYGDTKLVRGVPKWVAGTHVVTASWAFGGVPHGATKR